MFRVDERIPKRSIPLIDNRGSDGLDPSLIIHRKYRNPIFKECTENVPTLLFPQV